MVHSGCVGIYDNAKFGSIFADRDIVRSYFWYILDIHFTFIVHLKYNRNIPAAFCTNFSTFEPYLAAIPQAFWLHSYNIRGTFQYCSRTSLGVNSGHNDSILNIPKRFQLHSSCIRELMHLECAGIIWSEFRVNSWYSKGVLKKIFYYVIRSRMPFEFWKLLTPADFGWFRLHSSSVWRGL